MFKSLSTNIKHGFEKSVMVFDIWYLTRVGIKQKLKDLKHGGMEVLYNYWDNIDTYSLLVS